METKNMKQIDVESWICENQKLLIAIVRRYAPIRGRTVNAEKSKDGVLWTMRDLLMDKDTYSADYDQTEFDDYFQIACMGVLAAAKTYLPSKGAAFSTYAYQCAKNEILMEVRKWNGQERQIPCCFSEARWVLSSKHGGGISSEDDLCLEGSDREKAELQIIDNLCSSKKRLFPKASISSDVNTALEYKDFMQNLLSYAKTLHKFLPVILMAFSQGISMREVSKRNGYSVSTAGNIWMKCHGDVQNWIADWVAKTTE